MQSDNADFDVTTSTSPSDPYVHPLALCESTRVGPGTRIWPFAHVMADAVVGVDCNICGHSFIESGAVLGDRVTVKNGVMIWDGVTIADEVFIGPGVIFTNDLYPRSSRGELRRKRRERSAPQAGRLGDSLVVHTKVETGASIGAGAIIICGVTIGSRSMIAAGAVVTRNVPPQSLQLGNPARHAGWVCDCGRPLDKQNYCAECRCTCAVMPGNKAGE